MILPAIGLFILGTIFGSFLSVANYRIRKKEKGIFFGRSKCTQCHKNLKWYQLIPLISYIVSKGKCMSCNKKISITYPLLELSVGLTLVAIFIHIPFIELTLNSVQSFNALELLKYTYLSFVSVCLIGILFYDIQYMEIPEVYTFTAITVTILWGIFSPSHPIYDMAIGGGMAAIFFGGQVMLSNEKWLGSGDTQVGILMGLFFGWQLFLVSLVSTYFVGLFIVLILMAMKKVKRTSKIPFAPFLVTGTFITLFFGNYILDLYIRTLI